MPCLSKWPSESSSNLNLFSCNYLTFRFLTEKSIINPIQISWQLQFTITHVRAFYRKKNLSTKNMKSDSHKSDSFHYELSRKAPVFAENCNYETLVQLPKSASDLHPFNILSGRNKDKNARQGMSERRYVFQTFIRLYP